MNRLCNFTLSCFPSVLWFADVRPSIFVHEFLFPFMQLTPDEEQRRKLRRERNKVAASKCRMKRKEHVTTLRKVRCWRKRRPCCNILELIRGVWKIETHKSSCHSNGPRLPECRVRLNVLNFSLFYDERFLLRVLTNQMLIKPTFDLFHHFIWFQVYLIDRGSVVCLLIMCLIIILKSRTR